MSARDPWFADLRAEVRYVCWGCRSFRSLRPLAAKLLFHATRAFGKGGGTGRLSAPLQRLSFRLWSGVLINPRPLDAAVLAGLRSMDPEPENSHE